MMRLNSIRREYDYCIDRRLRISDTLFRALVESGFFAEE